MYVLLNSDVIKEKKKKKMDECERVDGSVEK